MSALTSSHASLRAAWERELAAALVDIARRPGRLVVSAPPHDAHPGRKEVTPPVVTPVQDKRKAPAPTGAKEIRRSDRPSRKELTS